VPVAYLSLDCLLVLVLGIEGLTDSVVETDPDKQALQPASRQDDIRREVGPRLRAGSWLAARSGAVLTLQGGRPPLAGRSERGLAGSTGARHPARGTGSWAHAPCSSNPPSPLARTHARTLPQVTVRRDVCLNLVDALWRTALGCLSALLAAARQEALVVALLRGYQCYTYSAGALGAVAARDGFLASLCEYTLLSDTSAVQQAEAQVGGAAGA
jgi:hypothetical protein